ncbi:MAG: GIY-YIG nuclease family protein, partial [Methanoregula sp.]
MIDTANLPENPGCYLYADENGTIIYVGKAKNLKKRVSSYFTKKDHDAKTRSLVAHIASVDVVVTDNETEAFLLENTLI